MLTFRRLARQCVLVCLAALSTPFIDIHWSGDNGSNGCGHVSVASAAPQASAPSNSRQNTSTPESVITVTRQSVISRSLSGDSWPSTWAEDDSLFFAWGDGTGQADCI